MTNAHPDKVAGIQLRSPRNQPPQGGMCRAALRIGIHRVAIRYPPQRRSAPFATPYILPDAVSYNRSVELESRVFFPLMFFPLMFFLNLRAFGRCTAITFVDSTMIPPSRASHPLRLPTYGAKTAHTHPKLRRRTAIIVHWSVNMLHETYLHCDARFVLGRFGRRSLSLQRPNDKAARRPPPEHDTYRLKPEYEIIPIKDAPGIPGTHDKPTILNPFQTLCSTIIPSGIVC